MATATKRKRGAAHWTRWMINRDLPQVVAIDAATAAGRSVEPWGDEDFLKYLRLRNCIGMVTERSDELTGFMVYELHRDRLHVLRFAAAPGTDAGAELWAKLLYKLDSHRRQYLTATGADGKPVILSGDVPTIRPEWLTSTVRALCGGETAPYTPILADALQDAGCDAAAFLAALRDEQIGATVYATVADQFAD